MGKTKPVWLVALQSAADDMMGNRLLTREEFEDAIEAAIVNGAKEQPGWKVGATVIKDSTGKVVYRRKKTSKTDWANLRPDGTRYRT